VSGKDAAVGDTRAGCRDGDVLKPYRRRFASVRARVQAKCGVDLRPPSRKLCPVVALQVQTIQCFYSIAVASLASPRHPRIDLYQTRAAAKRRASLPCLSTNSLLLPAVMPSPSSMLYYACHPQQLRSMIQWCAHAARILLRNCRQIVPR
jgi:hypothetical protein